MTPPPSDARYTIGIAHPAYGCRYLRCDNATWDEISRWLLAQLLPYAGNLPDGGVRILDFSDMSVWP